MESSNNQGANSQHVVIVQEKKSNGLGTAGLVLAIIGLLTSWIPVVGWIIWGLGLLFSFIGLFKSPRGGAIAGFILSIIGLLVLTLLIGALALI